MNKDSSQLTAWQEFGGVARWWARVESGILVWGVKIKLSHWFAPQEQFKAIYIYIYVCVRMCVYSSLRLLLEIFKQCNSY